MADLASASERRRFRSTSEPTLRDVASAAGVHPATVSKVLHAANVRVSDQTRARILAEAERLRYNPNLAARGLRGRRTNVVAFLVPDLGNIGFSELSLGVLSAAQSEGYLTLIARADQPGERDDLARLLRGRADGILIATATLGLQELRRWTESPVPVTFVNRRAVIGNRAPASSYVIADDEAATCSAIRYLHALGHRAIGHLSGPRNTDTGTRRLRAYRSEMRRLGLDYRRDWVAEGDYTLGGGRRAMTAVLSRCTEDRPTAFFAANLMMGIGALSAIAALGLDVPKDISLIAMDEHELAAHTVPPLTTVSTPLAQVGAEAFRLLKRLMSGGSTEHVIVRGGTEIIERESVRPAHTADTRRVREGIDPLAGPQQPRRTGGGALS